MSLNSTSQTNNATNDAPSEAMRLQRFLARSGVASRRKCEQLISEGRISVNGHTVTEMGTKVDPIRDIVCFDGNRVLIEGEQHTFKLNKPIGYLTSMSDPQHRKCVSELMPLDEFPSLYPIGRLDFDTSGLLLFSTNGEVGQALMHPSKVIEKEYIAKVKGSVKEPSLDKLRSGITLDDVTFQPAKCKIIERNADSTTVSVVIHEGKNRQVRRMFGAIGHDVIELKRLSVGPIELGDLASGEYIELTEEEYAQLNAALSLS